MKLTFTTPNRNYERDLIRGLEDNKIKFSQPDENYSTFEFDVKTREAAQDLQMSLTNNVLGAGIPGSFNFIDD